MGNVDREILTGFFLVDDDYICNLITETTIKATIANSQIKSFTDATDALTYLNSFNEFKNIVLLFDLNMPLISGWEFLEEFDNLPKGVKDSIDIYILSSSIDHRDKDMADVNVNVSDFFTKPISKAIVSRIANTAA